MALARTLGGGADRRQRPAGRDRGRPVRRPARPVVHRSGRHVGRRVARPDPGRDPELRRRVAEPQDHGRAAARRRPQGRLALRPRASPWRCSAAPEQMPRRARSPTRSGSPNSASTGGCGRCAACCRRCVAAQQAGVRRVVVAPRQRRRGRAGRPASTCARPTTCARCVAWLRGDGPAPAPRRARRRARPPAGRRSISPTSPASRRPSGRSRSRRPAATTCTFVGAPGAGKTMLAERLPGLLPALDDAAALEVTAVHSVAGLLGAQARLLRRATAAGAAPHRVGRVAGRRRHRTWPARARSAWPITACCSSTRRRSSRRARSTRCASRSRAARSCCIAAAARCATRPGSSSCWPPTRARAAVAAATASARRRRGAATSSDCPGRCSIASTCGSTSTRCRTPTCSPTPAGERSAAVRGPGRRGPGGRRRSGGPARRGGSTATVPGRGAARGAVAAAARGAAAGGERTCERGELSARGFDRVLRMAWTRRRPGRSHASPDAGDVAEALFFRTGEAACGDGRPDLTSTTRCCSPGPT